MRDRVYSLETEYAIQLRGNGPRGAGLRSDAIQLICRLLSHTYGLPRSQFLVNGSRVYADVGHPEWSLPECRDPREAAVYDKAADFTLAGLIAEVEEQLGCGVSLVKNNVDPAGNTYGCHENYMAERTTPWLGMEDHLRLTVRYLVPFLVTRQIFAGAGRIGWGPRGEEGPRFQISQRADFIDQVVSKNTLKSRAIVNLGRETEPLMHNTHRRLHLILADANPSGWATYMKLGTTGLVLRALEHIDVENIPHLADPVLALRQISRDPTCKARVSLRGGKSATAVEIQREYLRQVEAHLGRVPASSEEQAQLDEWRNSLDVLAEDPMGLDRRADWVTKKRLLDRHLARQGLSFETLAPQSEPFFSALRMDIQYHDLSPKTSLYRRLLGDRPDTLVTKSEILRAVDHAPPFTRARIRGEVIAAARRGPMNVSVDRWDAVELGGGVVPLPDPLLFVEPTIFRLFEKGA